MKTSSFLILFIGLIFIFSFKCNKETESLDDNCFKARLEIKGVCANYTIKVLEGNINPAKVKAIWTDPATGKVHTNVFALGNPCAFPKDINEGDVFYFSLAENSTVNCAICEAYRAKPDVANNIKVSKTACP